MTPFPYKSYKKSRCIRLYAVVEACFPGTYKINHCSVQQREINVFSDCGAQKYRVTRVTKENFVQIVHCSVLRSDP